MNHNFGGDWTEQKLSILWKYLPAYTTALKFQSQWEKIYVDAFAGTGFRTQEADDPEEKRLIEELSLKEDAAYFQGSASIALEIEPAFDRYVFVEQKASHVQELEKLRLHYPQRADAITIVQGDANRFLQSWSTTVHRSTHRAVVFLDPYGMQVDWTTLEALAVTRLVDLWLLFPLGQAVNRVLTRREPPPPHWSAALTRTLGTEDWQQKFYEPQKALTLFGEEETEVKIANFENIAQFFIERLGTIFSAVAENPLYLYSRNRVPLYLLCFAAANPKGALLARKIAQDILKT